MSRSLQQCVALSRRSFLVASGGFTIGLSFVGAGPAAAADAAAASAAQRFEPNAWVTIDRQGIVTLMSPAAEMGQGSMTGVPMCLANELDIEWSNVRVQHAPSVPGIFGNPEAFMMMATHSDNSTLGYFDKVRMVGAQTRRLLMQTAADTWHVPLVELSTEPGRVVHARSGRRIGYGDLVATAQVPATLPELTAADLKPRDQWRLIGHDTPRVDIPAKVDGSAVFGLDVQVPGMLYAAMLYPPVRREQPLEVDDAAARAVPGVLKIVVLERGVGVIASNVQATRRAKAALKVKWSSRGPARQYDSEQVAADYRRVAADLGQAGVVMHQHGDAPAKLAAAGSRTLVREFHSEHVAHATMEPPAATARLDADGGVTLWVGTQSVSNVMDTVSRALGIKPEQVRVNRYFMGGGFGRLGEDSDPSLDAALLARAVPQQPVKLIRSREDEFQNDLFRPLSAQRIEASVGPDGLIDGWRHRIVTSSHFGRVNPYLLDNILHGQDPVAAYHEHPYALKDTLVQWVRAERGWDVGPWRGVGGGYSCFAIESVIDEIAAQQKVDPVAYRQRLLGDNARAQAVLQRVVKMAQWDRPRPRGRALGLAMSSMSKTLAAQVVEVSITPQRQIRVHRAWVAADPGTIVNPDAVRAQLEGAFNMGLGPALYERVAVKAGEPQAMNFGAYAPPRLSQVPESIEVALIDSGQPPGGVGEIGVTMVAPAIAAAVARLTGQRLRSLPLALA